MKKSALNVFANLQSTGRLFRSDVEEDTILFGYPEGTPAANAVSPALKPPDAACPPPCAAASAAACVACVACS